MTGTPRNSSDAPVRSLEDLLRYFHEGVKTPAQWGIGLEYERIGLDATTARAVPYSGPRGIEAILGAMAEKFGWTPDLEKGRIIGLDRGETHVSLEPGGQFELSGRVHGDIAGMQSELAMFLRESGSICEPMGITLSPIGLHPVTPVEEIEWVPKGRYAIMAPFLRARGRLAHHMMKDAMEKLRVAMALSAVTTAASANSPLYAGKETGYLTRRAHIWTETDPARCGLPEFAFRDGQTFRDYAEYALDVPLLFVRRDGRWVDMEGIPFRTFLSEGRHGIAATEADWLLHLTTIFTEVRLKTYVEVRGLDSVPPALAIALAVLWKGILYDGTARRKAWDLVSRFDHPERLRFFDDVARLGPAARLGDATAGELATELVSIARDGLRRICGGSDLPPCAAGEDELLGPLEASLAEEGGCPAFRLVEAWRGGLNERPGRIACCFAREEQAFLSVLESGAAPDAAGAGRTGCSGAE